MAREGPTVVSKKGGNTGGKGGHQVLAAPQVYNAAVPQYAPQYTARQRITSPSTSRLAPPLPLPPPPQQYYQAPYDPNTGWNGNDGGGGGGGAAYWG
jgi:hypothetical protein